MHVGGLPVVMTSMIMLRAEMKADGGAWKTDGHLLHLLLLLGPPSPRFEGAAQQLHVHGLQTLAGVGTGRQRCPPAG